MFYLALACVKIRIEISPKNYVFQWRHTEHRTNHNSLRASAVFRNFEELNAGRG